MNLIVQHTHLYSRMYRIPMNKEVHTAGHKYCSYQVIGNVETGLF